MEAKNQPQQYMQVPAQAIQVQYAQTPMPMAYAQAAKPGSVSYAQSPMPVSYAQTPMPSSYAQPQMAAAASTGGHQAAASYAQAPVKTMAGPAGGMGSYSMPNSTPNTMMSADSNGTPTMQVFHFVFTQ